jgi:heme/copper-type cytochrome/quinol oxidase subunit 2
MPSLVAVLIFTVVVWRLAGFVASYRRARARKADQQAEREQRQDWARRMQGRSEQG